MSNPVQAVTGASGSGSGSTPLTVTTAAGNFPNATVAGNLLVCGGWVKGTASSIADQPAFTGPPTTSGFTWTSGPGSSWSRSSNRHSGAVGIWYIANAASMAPGVWTTLSATFGGSGQTISGAEIEFTLYEFSGIDTSSPFDVSHFSSSGAGGTPPATANLATSATDLIMVAFSADATGGSNISAGSGYTLGVNAAAATIGQTQYELGVAAGSIATAFSGTEPPWAAISIAFKQATTPILDVTPPTLTFAAVEFGANPPSQDISISNGDGGTLNWTVASDEAWLSAAPLSGSEGSGSGSYIAKPTVVSVDAPDQWANPSNAYDPDPGRTTFAQGSDSNLFPLGIGGGNPTTATYGGFAAATGSPTAITLNVSAATQVFGGGGVGSTFDLTYSLNGGVTYTRFPSFPTTGNNAQATYTFTLNPAQDLTAIRVRANVSWAGPSVTADIKVYDIWVEVTEPGSAQAVTASVDITGLTPNVYVGHLTVTASGATGSPATVTVTLTVNNPTPVLSVAPLTLSYTTTPSQGNPTSQIVTVSNTGPPFTMPFTVSAPTAAWLGVAPSSGDAGLSSVPLTVSVDITGLTPNVYAASFVVTASSASGSPQTVNVTLTLNADPTPILSVVPLTLAFAASQAQGNPATKTVTVSNVGLPFTMPFTVSTPTATWLGVSPSSGDAGLTAVPLTIGVNISGLLSGVYSATFIVTASTATSSPQTVTVTLTIVDIFNYVKSFDLTSGGQRTLALDESGTLWVEDVVSDPFVLTPLSPTVIAGSRALSTTQDDVEYLCFSDLAHGTDIPRQYNPQPANLALAPGDYTLDRISQVGPGAPPTFQATVSGPGSQAAITSWAAVGDVITFQAVNSFVAGEIVVLSGFTVSTFFNKQAVQVLGTGLTAAQFEAVFVGATGASDSGVATPQFGYGIQSITQPAAHNILPLIISDNLLWSLGVASRSPGSTITVFYGDQTAGQPQDATLVNQFNNGIPVYVYIVGAVFGNGTQQVTQVGLYHNPNGRSYWYFSFDAPSVQFQFVGSLGTWQLSIATVTLQTAAPGLAIGDQVTVSGVTPSAWNSVWAIENALNAGTYRIILTSLTGGVATYSWQWAGTGPAITPVSGQLVTVIQTLNGNGVFNVVDALIATVTGGPNSGTFTITGFSGPNVNPAAENGQAETSGTTFQFDPGQAFVGTLQNPIYGNAGAGGILSVVGSSTAIAAGTRRAVVFFETRNGYKTAASAFVTFTTDLDASVIIANNIPLGPPNVVRRWIAFTGAGPNGIPGPFYYTIDTPVTYKINGQTYRYTATYIDDNVSTTASFVFTDAVLLSSEEIDVQGNNLFSQIELGSAAWNISYASRMFYGLEENKVLNFTNLSFDGGYLPNPGSNLYPLGWGVDPASNPGNVADIATVTAYTITIDPHNALYRVITFTAANDFVEGQIVILDGMSAPFTSLDGQQVTLSAATSTTFSFIAYGYSVGSGSATGTATLLSNQYGVNLQASSVFGNSILIYNTSASVIPTVGMLTQTAYQDVYNVPIILPNTQYSVRVACRIPNGATAGSLVIDLTQSNQGLVSGTGTLTGYGITFGSFVLPLTGVTADMAIYSGTLLTTPFTGGVPSGLVLRIWGQNLGANVNIEVDRFEIYPTATPVLSTNVRVSYASNFEAFDAVTGNIGLAAHNTQPVNGAFELHDQLYFLQESSMQSTQDVPGVEPSGPIGAGGSAWAVHEVSNRVGACGIYAYDYGEEWMLTACRNGLYGFNGGQPIRIDFQQKELWDRINWKHGNSIVVRNDLAERRVVAAVPLLTPNPWLPFAATNADPVTPNVILMWSYQGLDDFQELVSGRAMHTTMFGTLVSTDMRVKMSIWQIPTQYIGLITQPDLLTQLPTICGMTPGKLYQQTTAQLSDDGAAINSLYTTFGFVNALKAKDYPLLGLHAKRYSLLQTLISGIGNCVVQVFPNYVLDKVTLTPNPQAYTVPGGITLQAQPTDDIMRPLNMRGQRVFLMFQTNAVGAAFNLSKVLLVGSADLLTTLNPNSG